MKLKCFFQKQCHNIHFDSTLKSNVLTIGSLYVKSTVMQCGVFKISWHSMQGKCTFCTKFDNMNFCFTNMIFKRKCTSRYTFFRNFPEPAPIPFFLARRGNPLRYSFIPYKNMAIFIATQKCSTYFKISSSPATLFQIENRV